MKEIRCSRKGRDDVSLISRSFSRSGNKPPPIVCSTMDFLGSSSVAMGHELACTLEEVISLVCVENLSNRLSMSVGSAPAARSAEFHLVSTRHMEKNSVRRPSMDGVRADDAMVRALYAAGQHEAAERRRQALEMAIRERQAICGHDQRWLIPADRNWIRQCGQCTMGWLQG
jgi:hypothetical protein